MKVNINKILLSALMAVGGAMSQHVYATQCLPANNSAKVFSHSFNFDENSGFKLGDVTPLVTLNSGGTFKVTNCGDVTKNQVYVTLRPGAGVGKSNYDSVYDRFWYEIPGNDYLQVSTQVYIGGHQNKFFNVPQGSRSTLCTPTDSCPGDFDTGSQANIRLKIIKEFIGKSFIVDREVALIYMGTTFGEPTVTSVASVRLSVSIVVPQTCAFDVGDIIEFDFGAIPASAFSKAGAGMPAQGVNVISKTLNVQCKNLNAGRMLTARLEANNYKGNVLVSSNPDVGFQIAGSNSGNIILTPNDPLSAIPFFLDSAQRGSFILKSWPVSLTGKRPVAGPVSAQGYIRLDFQ